MTTAQLVKRVTFWQKKLGLDHWDIEVEVVESPHASGNSNLATAACWSSDTYDNAKIEIREDYAEWELEDLDQTIIHELMHIVTRDIDRTARLLREEIGASAWNLYSAVWDREIEGLVDRLAKIVHGNTDA